ncbi:MAG: outer membrane protein assembly factor BamA [Hyphomicrobiaceae bacterium]|nr:outer membrane protein assembly factor BamA [Hyphomicrobiaceae bacterium]
MARGGFASRLIVAVLMLVGLGLAAASNAHAAVITSVQVVGNQRVEAATVRSYLTVSPGDNVDAGDLNESLKALFDTGLFSDVRMERRGSVLVVTVAENPIIRNIAFEGNRRLDDATLSAVVQSRSRAVLTEARLQNDTQRVLEAYRRSGRFTAHVEPKIIQLEGNRVDVVFEITEGPKTSVSRITFIGNRAFSDGKLRDIIQTAQSNILSFLQSNDIYDPDRLNADQERLRRFYLSEGYADFRIISAVAELDEEQNVFYVTFTVDEGERYTFGSINIDSSLREIDTEALRDVLETDEGDTYNADAVDRSIENLTIEVARFGYAFAQVRPRGDRNFAEQTIDITYFIDEGPRVYVERINITGNHRTREYVIRREFDLAEGDAFNRVLVDRAKRRLEQLNFFDEVRITTEPGSAPDRVVINVNVVEKATGEFSFGVGYSTTDGVIGDISVTERNFLGRGQYVRVVVGGGESRRSFDFGFTEPYFMGRRLSFGFDLFRRVTGDNSYTSYESDVIGGQIRFGIPLTQNLTLQLRAGAQNQEITIPRPSSCPAGADLLTHPCYSNISLAIRAAAGEALTISTGWTLTYNTLDSNRQPRSGIYAQLSQDFAGFGGDVNFIRTQADVRAYRSLSTQLDIIGMLRVQGGHIFSWDSSDLRMFDTFFRGGDLVRGFEPSGIGPRDRTTGDALGGTIYAGATAEVVFPIWGLPPELGFRGALFADAGTLFEVSDQATALLGAAAIDDDSTIRSSVGASIIWNSPFGPLRGDFAYVINKADSDRTQVFRFSGGTQF